MTDSFDAMMSALPMEMIAVASKSAFSALVAFGVNKLAAYGASKVDRMRMEGGEGEEGEEEKGKGKGNQQARSITLDAKVEEFNRLQLRLASTLSSITPAAGLLELAATRGNTLLDPVVNMIRRARGDVESLTAKIEGAMIEKVTRDTAAEERELDGILEMIPRLLANLDALVPLLQLNLAASGLSVSLSIPQSVSLSRAFRASHALLRASDAEPGTWARIACYPVTLYTLFESHGRTPNRTKDTEKVDWSWQEKFPRAEASLWRRRRVSDGQIEMELRVLENLDDGRHHDPSSSSSDPGFDSEIPPGSRGDVLVYRLEGLIKLHLATDDMLLNLQDEKGEPVLLLKFGPPLSEEQGGKNEWIAFGEYREVEDSGSEDSDSSSSDEDEEPDPPSTKPPRNHSVPGAGGSKNLSELEHLLRLSELELHEQLSHLDAPDEVLSLYLSGLSQPESQAPVHTPSSMVATPRGVNSPGGLLSPGTPGSGRMWGAESPLARSRLARVSLSGTPSKGKSGRN